MRTSATPAQAPVSFNQIPHARNSVVTNTIQQEARTPPLVAVYSFIGAICLFRWLEWLKKEGWAAWGFPESRLATFIELNEFRSLGEFKETAKWFWNLFELDLLPIEWMEERSLLWRSS